MVLNKLFSVALIALFILEMFVPIQLLYAMEKTTESMVEETLRSEFKNKINKQDVKRYLLLSSINIDQTFLLADIALYIMMYAHNITNFLMYECDMHPYCNTHLELWPVSRALHHLYGSNVTMQTALLKISLHDWEKSLFDIKIHLDNSPEFLYYGVNSSWTLFDCNYAPDEPGLPCESLMKVWCSIVDRKAFVCHFTEFVNPFLFLHDRRDRNLHRFVRNNTNAVIFKLYCDLILEYIQDCPKKIKGGLELLRAKDGKGYTIGKIARKNKLPEIVAIIKDTKKELKRREKKQKKESKQRIKK